MSTAKDRAIFDAAIRETMRKIGADLLEIPRQQEKTLSRMYTWWSIFQEALDTDSFVR